MASAITTAPAEEPAFLAELLKQSPPLWEKYEPTYGRLLGSYYGSLRPAESKLRIVVGVIAATILKKLDRGWSVYLQEGDDGPRSLVFDGGAQGRVSLTCRIAGRWLAIQGARRVYLATDRAGEHVLGALADTAARSLLPAPPKSLPPRRWNPRPASESKVVA